MALNKYGSSSSSNSPAVGITEFEILKASHKFLREGDEQASSWNEQLAAKYYDTLYREFALCDLKHFKSGNFALRWRTEEEVLNGIGETTCGNSRCEYHDPPSRYRNIQPPKLTTLELPFAYMERGETKSALVKVVLCNGCVRKLMWKRRKEKEKITQEEKESKAPEVVSGLAKNSAVVDQDQDSRVSSASDSRTKKRKTVPYPDVERRQGGDCGRREGASARGDQKRSSRSRSPRIIKPKDGSGQPSRSRRSPF